MKKTKQYGTTSYQQVQGKAESLKKDHTYCVVDSFYLNLNGKYEWYTDQDYIGWTKNITLKAK